MPKDLSLSTLQPAQKRRDRKRIGRGLGSGKGRYSGRGIKGQKARSGSNKMRPGFEGGQMPIYMRLGKQRGPYSKDAMPVGPHRTATVPVNLRDLDRAFADGDEVTLETLREKGLIKNTKTDVKILGTGELKKKLRVTAHAFSASAREKIEAAGGQVTPLREPVEKKKRARPKKTTAPEPEEPEPGEPEAKAEPVGAGQAPPGEEAEATEEASE
jgi:large subunit ribosomal protein L15